MMNTKRSNNDIKNDIKSTLLKVLSRQSTPNHFPDMVSSTFSLPYFFHPRIIPYSRIASRIIPCVPRTQNSKKLNPRSLGASNDP